MRIPNPKSQIPPTSQRPNSFLLPPLLLSLSLSLSLSPPMLCRPQSTPNMDALAAKSVRFDNAYVAVAWCSPSRTALLTSRRPDTTRTWSVVPEEYWRERGGNFTTLPQVGIWGQKSIDRLQIRACFVPIVWTLSGHCLSGRYISAFLLYCLASFGIGEEGE